MHLQEVGAEYGTTTGRRRRCGWLDLVVLKHSTLINGYTSFNLTKLDVLDQLSELKIGTAYEVDGKELDYFPADLELVARVQVKYVTLPGWKTSIEACRTWDALPKAAKEYVDFIEKFTGVKVEWIGVGPGKDASECLSLLSRLTQLTRWCSDQKIDSNVGRMHCNQMSMSRT